MARLPSAAVLQRLNPLSSIRGKITFLLLVLTVMAGAAGFVTYRSFDGVSREVNHLTHEVLPQLDQSNALVDAANETQKAMIRVVTAPDVPTLTATRSDVHAAVTHLDAATASLPPEIRADFAENVTRARNTLESTISARTRAFDSAQQVNNQARNLQSSASKMQGVLLELSDDAYFDISIQGEDTIGVIEEALLDLTETKFATLQALLEIRSEVNLLSGVTLALGSTFDSAMASILSDIATSAHDRLGGALDTIPDRATADVLSETVDQLKTQVLAARSAQGIDRDAILRLRQDAEVTLSSAADDVVFDLTIAADDATSANRDAIQSLLDNEVASMTRLLEINSTLGNLQLAAMKIAAAKSTEAAQAAGRDLQNTAASLQRFASFGDGRLADPIAELAQIADPDTGLTSFRIESIKADAAASDAADQTVQAVLQIAAQATQRRTQSQADIREAASFLSTDAAKVQQNLTYFGWTGIALVVGALLLNHLLIAQPLNRISLTTERLSQGDMSPVEGFDRSSDEISRIARALTVFRDGLVEKETMAKRAEEKRIANETRQTEAVDAIGAALTELAGGNLNYRITEHLTEGYAKLKEDFNSTAETLNTTVVDVIQVAGSIRNGSSEISTASDDLARRTENQAATLEEAAAALERLTQSVKAAAQGAQDADDTTKDARSQAAESGKIVQSAVTAMKDIEDSSSNIAQIIGVIDDIAFQTNLLALNAGVEAARAGKAGRGFAVVASEVRELSQKTSDAAREIKALILKSSEQVEQGVEYVGRAGDALESIVSRVGQISTLVSDIADAAVEQANGLSETNGGIAQLDQVTQQNAAMVQETNAAANYLKQDSQKLTDLVAQFDVSTGHRQAQHGHAMALPRAS